MAVKDYKTNPDENTTISGINIAEGCPPSGINNAIRQLMADVKQNSDDQDKSIQKAATTIMKGATADAAGTSGNVPAPAAGKQDKPLNGAGQWADFLDCMVTSIKNTDGSALDASKLLEMLKLYLPLSGGNLTGSIYGNPSGTVNIGSNERFFRELCVKAVRMYNNKGVRVANLYSDVDTKSCVFSPDPDVGSDYNVLLGVSGRRLTNIETKRIASEDVYASLKNSFVLAQGTGNIGYRLPNGGTWTVLGIQGTSTDDIGNHSVFYDSVAGGTTVQGDGSHGRWFLFAFRRSI